MRLTATTNVSVDGVIQGLGGSNEDRRGGFDRGGWAPPLVDAEPADYLNQVYGGAARFLFARRTYEIFARAWGAIPEMATSTLASGLNGRHKYVASGTLTDPQWTGTTVLTGDIALAIRDLKAQQEGDLLVPGSGVLLRWLLANDLVDQFALVIYPVVIGTRTRLFPASGPRSAPDRVTSRLASGAIAMNASR